MTTKPVGLRTGETLEVTVEKGVYGGKGLARHEGQVLFVSRGLPGDRLRVRVGAVRPGYVEATPEAMLESSGDRRPSPCPYVPQCGGCAYQELSYPAQLRLKEAILRESLHRAGAAWDGEIPVRGSPEEGWRTRASFHFGTVEDALRLGLHEEGTRRVVDLGHCLQISSRMNRTARAIHGALEARPDLWRRVRGMDLAESSQGDDLVVALETDLDTREAAALRFVGEAAPALSGLVVVARHGRNRRYLGLQGDPHVHTAILGLTLRAHVRSFFQANRFLVEELVQSVVEATPGGGTVLDLYAGVGLFSLSLAMRCERVLGVELNPTAVEDAAANARRAGLGTVRILQGDVRAGLLAWPSAPGERIVLDPPRSGAGAEVVRAVAARRPQCVVYVSCDPPTLGRDLATFAREGYRPDLVRAFDLFPDTFHLETVVRLVPAGPGLS
jgi:23S rRNA (uracil1939-C5)-methyltransferase